MNDHLDRLELSPELGGPCDPIWGPDKPTDDAPLPLDPTPSPTTPAGCKARHILGISDAGGGGTGACVQGARAATTAAGV